MYIGAANDFVFHGIFNINTAQKNNLKALIRTSLATINGPEHEIKCLPNSPPNMSVKFITSILDKNNWWNLNRVNSVIYSGLQPASQIDRWTEIAPTYVEATVTLLWCYKI